MAVKSDDIIELSNRRFTGDGSRRAFATLEEKVGSGDQRLICWSGHGTQEAGSGGPCREALVGLGPSLSAANR